MDPATRQALTVARSLADVDFDGLDHEELAAWSRYARPALADLVRHLDAVEHARENATAGERTPRPVCDGSRLPIHGHMVDGNGIATCPTCKRRRATFPSVTAGPGDWHRIEAHLVPLSTVQGAP